MPISFILLNLKESCVDPVRLRKTNLVSWTPPCHDCLMFNVDGYTRVQPGPAGIDGVLRDSKGHILCLFSLCVGSLDSNSTEILAIHKALQLCASNPSIALSKVSIVSDSKTAVSWSNNKDSFGSFSHLNTILDIKDILSSFQNFEIFFRPRSANAFADGLAKRGSSGEGFGVVWSDS
ncbi:hypothetical protein LWI28_006240 [Acer negundo]|uniref:RNase H type-1 domain-containing protein n=1 Tax=Acer negundo TaxID=4023 RepID=A0AAD5IYT0_ACENE|nr:hypothetical protein LWI28_006240 [Acer negundo]